MTARTAKNSVEKRARRAKKGPTAGENAPAQGGKGPEAAAKIQELVDMEEAIRILKTTRPTFYRWLRSGRLKGMKLGRQWRFYREDIDRFVKGLSPRIDLPADIRPLIETLRRKVEELGAKDLAPSDAGDVQHAVSLMIVLASATNASDIHITSHMLKDGTESIAVLRNRIDGTLHEVARFDLRLLPAVVEEWKRMAAVDVHEKVLPQDGRILIKRSEVSGTGPDKLLDLRVSFLPTGLGEAVTVRILDRVAVNLDLKRIDYTPSDREKILRAVRSPWGVILVTGPTGCGKTTVLYSCLNEIAGTERKVMSVEDPIEFLLPWVSQVAVNERAGLTFARAMRAMLRSDPDVILIGEIRDYETLCVAQQAALTGHLILTTLHANDAAGALKRMVEMGSDPFVVADSTRMVMSQRLVRKLCVHCSVEERPESSRLDLAAEAARKGGLDWHSLSHGFKKAIGCEKCARTGYKGRTVITEVLEVTPEIGRALRNNASVDEIRTIAVGQGMTTLAADGVRRAAAGETTLDEIIRVIGA
jgi:general secretion pathway protein E